MPQSVSSTRKVQRPTLEPSLRDQQRREHAVNHFYNTMASAGNPNKKDANSKAAGGNNHVNTSTTSNVNNVGSSLDPFAKPISIRDRFHMQVDVASQANVVGTRAGVGGTMTSSSLMSRSPSKYGNGGGEFNPANAAAFGGGAENATSSGIHLAALSPLRAPPIPKPTVDARPLFGGTFGGGGGGASPNAASSRTSAYTSGMSSPTGARKIGGNGKPPLGAITRGLAATAPTLSGLHGPSSPLGAAAGNGSNHFDTTTTATTTPPKPYRRPRADDDLLNAQVININTLAPGVYASTAPKPPSRGLGGGAFSANLPVRMELCHTTGKMVPVTYDSDDDDDLDDYEYGSAAAGGGNTHQQQGFGFQMSAKQQQMASGPTSPHSIKSGGGGGSYNGSNAAAAMGLGRSVSFVGPITDALARGGGGHQQQQQRPPSNTTATGGGGINTPSFGYTVTSPQHNGHQIDSGPLITPTTDGPSSTSMGGWAIPVVLQKTFRLQSIVYSNPVVRLFRDKQRAPPLHLIEAAVKGNRHNLLQPHQFYQWCLRVLWLDNPNFYNADAGGFSRLRSQSTATAGIGGSGDGSSSTALSSPSRSGGRNGDHVGLRGDDSLEGSLVPKMSSTTNNTKVGTAVGGSRGNAKDGGSAANPTMSGMGNDMSGAFAGMGGDNNGGNGSPTRTRVRIANTPAGGGTGSYFEQRRAEAAAAEEKAKPQRRGQRRGYSVGSEAGRNSPTKASSTTGKDATTNNANNKRAFNLTEAHEHLGQTPIATFGKRGGAAGIGGYFNSSISISGTPTSMPLVVGGGGSDVNTSAMEDEELAAELLLAAAAAAASGKSPRGAHHNNATNPHVTAAQKANLIGDIVSVKRLQTPSHHTRARAKAMHKQDGHEAALHNGFLPVGITADAGGVNGGNVVLQPKLLMTRSMRLKRDAAAAQQQQQQGGSRTTPPPVAGAAGADIHTSDDDDSQPSASASGKQRRRKGADDGLNDDRTLLQNGGERDDEEDEDGGLNGRFNRSISSESVASACSDDYDTTPSSVRAPMVMMSRRMMPSADSFPHDKDIRDVLEQISDPQEKALMLNSLANFRRTFFLERQRELEAKRERQRLVQLQQLGGGGVGLGGRRHSNKTMVHTTSSSAQEGGDGADVFAQAMQQLSTTVPFTRAEVQQVFQLLDANDDGVLEHREMCDGMVHLLSVDGALMPLLHRFQTLVEPKFKRDVRLVRISRQELVLFQEAVVAVLMRQLRSKIRRRERFIEYFRLSGVLFPADEATSPTRNKQVGVLNHFDDNIRRAAAEKRKGNVVMTKSDGSLMIVKTSGDGSGGEGGGGRGGATDGGANGTNAANKKNKGGRNDTHQHLPLPSPTIDPFDALRAKRQFLVKYQANKGSGGARLETRQKLSDFILPENEDLFHQLPSTEWFAKMEAKFGAGTSNPFNPNHYLNGGGGGGRNGGGAAATDGARSTSPSTDPLSPKDVHRLQQEAEAMVDARRRKEIGELGRIAALRKEHARNAMQSRLDRAIEVCPASSLLTYLVALKQRDEQRVAKGVKAHPSHHLHLMSRSYDPTEAFAGGGSAAATAAAAVDGLGVSVAPDATTAAAGGTVPTSAAEPLFVDRDDDEMDLPLTALRTLTAPSVVDAQVAQRRRQQELKRKGQPAALPRYMANTRSSSVSMTGAAAAAAVAAVAAKASGNHTSKDATASPTTTNANNTASNNGTSILNNPEFLLENASENSRPVPDTAAVRAILNYLDLELTLPIKLMEQTIRRFFIDFDQHILSLIGAEPISYKVIHDVLRGGPHGGYSSSNNNGKWPRNNTANSTMNNTANNGQQQPSSTGGDGGVGINSVSEDSRHDLKRLRSTNVAAQLASAIPTPARVNHGGGGGDASDDSDGDDFDIFHINTANGGGVNHNRHNDSSLDVGGLMFSLVSDGSQMIPHNQLEGLTSSAGGTHTTSSPTRRGQHSKSSMPLSPGRGGAKVGGLLGNTLSGATDTLFDSFREEPTDAIMPSTPFIRQIAQKFFVGRLPFEKKIRHSFLSYYYRELDADEGETSFRPMRQQLQHPTLESVAAAVNASQQHQQQGGGGALMNQQASMSFNRGGGNPMLSGGGGGVSHTTAAGSNASLKSVASVAIVANSLASTSRSGASAASSPKLGQSGHFGSAGITSSGGLVLGSNTNNNNVSAVSNGSAANAPGANNGAASIIPTLTLGSTNVDNSRRTLFNPDSPRGVVVMTVPLASLVNNVIGNNGGAPSTASGTSTRDTATANHRNNNGNNGASSSPTNANNLGNTTTARPNGVVVTRPQMVTTTVVQNMPSHTNDVIVGHLLSGDASSVGTGAPNAYAGLANLSGGTGKAAASAFFARRKTTAPNVHKPAEEFTDTEYVVVDGRVVTRPRNAANMYSNNPHHHHNSSSISGIDGLGASGGSERGMASPPLTASTTVNGGEGGRRAATPQQQHAGQRHALRAAFTPEPTIR